MDVLDHSVDPQRVQLVAPLLLKTLQLPLFELGAVDLAEEVEGLDHLVEWRLLVVNTVQKRPVALLEQSGLALLVVVRNHFEPKRSHLFAVLLPLSRCLDVIVAAFVVVVGPLSVHLQTQLLLAELRALEDVAQRCGTDAASVLILLLKLV